MRVGFAGTPEFARVALCALIASHHPVALVLTQPDRPSGRGLKLTSSPVKQAALDANIAVLQPPSLKLDGRFPQEAHAAHAALAEAALDVLIVAAYGLILPQSVLDLPRHGCLNIHASLLPRWRGAAPVQRAIEAGDAVTGVCIMQMEAGLDTGAVMLQRQLPISADVTAGDLTEALAHLGAQALLETLDLVEAGRAHAVAQATEGITYAEKIRKEEARLRWSEPAALLERRVRAFHPQPGAHTYRGEDMLKILRARRAPASAAAPPGTIVACGPQGVVVACGEDVLVLDEVQRAGGRPVAAAAYAKASGLQPGEILT